MTSRMTIGISFNDRNCPADWKTSFLISGEMLYINNNIVCVVRAANEVI